MEDADLMDEQLPLTAFVPVGERCEAFADSTGERCERSAVGGLPYCSDHRHLLDDVDRARIAYTPRIEALERE